MAHRTKGIFKFVPEFGKKISYIKFGGNNKLVPTRENQQVAAILSAILFIVLPMKPIMKLGQEFDGSNPSMKFGRNPMKNEQVRVTMDRRTYLKDGHSEVPNGP